MVLRNEPFWGGWPPHRIRMAGSGLGETCRVCGVPLVVAVRRAMLCAGGSCARDEWGEDVRCVSERRGGLGGVHEAVSSTTYCCRCRAFVPWHTKGVSSRAVERDIGRVWCGDGSVPRGLDALFPVLIWSW